MRSSRAARSSGITRVSAPSFPSAGVNVGGHAELGDNAMVGMGAVIVNGTRIGSDATVAAGAVVLREVGVRSRVQGIPARDYFG